MPDTTRQWYVLRVISGREARVKEYIEAAKAKDPSTAFSQHVFDVLIPTEKIYLQRNGKKVPKERPVLPGYLLVEAELVNDIAYTLRHIPDVMGFLGGMDNPQHVSEADMNRYLGRIDNMQEDIIELDFVVGESVKVNHGPFLGFTGVVEEVNNEKKKLKVMVKIFGRKTPLELGFMQVEKE